MRSLAVALAVAVVLVAACRDSKRGTDPVGSDSDIGENAAYHHTKQLLSFGPRPPQSAALRKCREYLATELAKAGWLAANQTVTTRTPAGTMTFINVIARYGGGDGAPWQRPVDGILGAHLDSKIMPPPNNFVGADDAASSVAAILSLVTKLTPEEAARLEVVFFDGEEAIGANMGPRPGGIFDGLYGSRAYMDRWAQSTTKPQWGFILDMIGHKNQRIRLPVDSPPPLAERLLAAAAAEGAGDTIKMGDGEVLDDHSPLNAGGIPAINMLGDFGFFDWWHTDDDNLSLISPENLARSEAVALRFLRDLLANPPYSGAPNSPPAGSTD